MLILLFLFSQLAIGADMRVLSVALNQTEQIELPSIREAVLGNGKIAKVRVMSSRLLLITGVKMGETSLKVWDASGKVSSFLIRIIPSYLNEKTKPIVSERVVKISLGFIEINQTKAKELGIKFPEFLEMGAQAVLLGRGNFSGLNYLLSFHSPKTLLNSFIRNGEAKLIAEPEISVRLGEEALFHSGGEIPVATTSEHFGRTHKKVEWKPFGLTFKVKPESVDGYHLSSDIRLELSEINEATQVEGVPAILKRKVETKIDSIEGETICLSGLVRQMTSQNHRQVPGLSAIPLVGPLLFSSSGNKEESTELLVTLKMSFASSSKKQYDDKKDF